MEFMLWFSDHNGYTTGGGNDGLCETTTISSQTVDLAATSTSTNNITHLIINKEELVVKGEKQGNFYYNGIAF